MIWSWFGSPSTPRCKSEDNPILEVNSKKCSYGRRFFLLFLEYQEQQQPKWIQTLLLAIDDIAVVYLWDFMSFSCCFFQLYEKPEIPIIDSSAWRTGRHWRTSISAFCSWNYSKCSQNELKHLPKQSCGSELPIGSSFHFCYCLV